MADTETIDSPKTLNRPELILAGILAALGLYAALSGFGFGVGTLARMGPGFFPAMLGAILIALAIALVFEQRFAPKVALEMPWRALLFIFIGLSFWAGTIKLLGLAPATFGLILISSLAERPYRPVSALVVAVTLAIGGVVLFIYGFRLPIAAFNW